MKKKIEKEETNYVNEYAPVIKAVIVLFVLIGLLVGAIIYQPTKKEEIKEPNTLDTNEKNINTDTSCDGSNAKSVKKDADKVSVIYEVIDDYFLGYYAEADEDINGNGIIDNDPVVEAYGYALKVKLTNVTDNIYVVITNDLDDKVKTFHSTDKGEDGIITWTEGETTFMRTYTVKVYSNKEGCTNSLYREFNVSLPKYNMCSDFENCKLDFTKDLDVCQPFIFSNKKDTEELREYKRVIQKVFDEHYKNKDKTTEAVENKEETKEETIVDKVINYVKANYIVFCIVGGAIIALIIIFIVKKGRK